MQLESLIINALAKIKPKRSFPAEAVCIPAVTNAMLREGLHEYTCDNGAVLFIVDHQLFLAWRPACFGPVPAPDCHRLFAGSGWPIDFVVDYSGPAIPTIGANYRLDAIPSGIRTIFAVRFATEDMAALFPLQIIVHVPGGDWIGLTYLLTGPSITDVLCIDIACGTPRVISYACEIWSETADVPAIREFSIGGCLDVLDPI